MTEKRFPSILNMVIFVDTGHELTKEEIIEQMMAQKPIISDEEAFERHLIRKWTKDGELNEKLGLYLSSER